MSRQNVVLLLTDQQQAATVCPDSTCRTPNLDKLFESGTRFERCYASNPICSPSRASLMTGVLPHTHGMTNVTHGIEPYGARFRPELETWSERLADAGYQNGYFGKWHVERTGDLSSYGFDEYEVRRSEAFQSAFRDHRSSLGLSPMPDRSPSAVSDPIVVEDEGYDDYLLSGRVDEPIEGMSDYYVYSQGIDFIERVAECEEPWSTVISTYAPHDPYLAPTACRERYDASEIPKPESFHDTLKDKPAIYARQRRVWEDLSWEDCAEAIACYYAYCSFVDAQVGRVVDALQKTDQLEDTVILYASDHGDYSGAHGMFLKGVPSFEEAYRVPCLVRTPDEYPGGVVRDEIVQLHDLAPTIVDLATGEEFPPTSKLPPKNPQARGGYNLPDQDEEPSFTATSLVPFLHDRRPTDHAQEAFAEFHGQDFGWTQRVYWTETQKYVFNTFDEDELYDLSEDPNEIINLTNDAEYRSTKKALAERMWEIARETNDYQISELYYGMHRFGPVGPNGRE